MRLLKNFSPVRFIVLIIVVGVLTFFSFFNAFGKDEGTLGDSIFLNFMADTFYVFRFPTHVLFWKYMSGGTFYLGLFINILFYSAVIEIIISTVIKRKKFGTSAD
jgi:hypothetical protein